MRLSNAGGGTPRDGGTPRGGDGSRRPRSVDSVQYRQTPISTPAYKYNDWERNGKHRGATPQGFGGKNGNGDAGGGTPAPGRSGVGHSDDGDAPQMSAAAMKEWEEEQTRLDRLWYNQDGGRDEDDDAFGADADYIKRKEEQLKKQQTKRVSAQRRQLNEDQDRWETNRMLQSGAVQRVGALDEVGCHSLPRPHSPPSNHLATPLHTLVLDTAAPPDHV